MIDIREQRKRLGMTQEEFANRLGVSTRTVQNWEQGGAIPASSRNAIERLLGGVEEKHGFDEVIARLDRIIELLERKEGV